ncbi:MAG: hypothetical protein V7K83_31960 [Nostoc sp.]
MSTTASYALAVKKLLSKIGRVNKTTQQLWGVSSAMPIYRKRYANNWDEIALAIKEAAQWRCRHCGQEYYRSPSTVRG